jgi:hypothetical protein
MDTFRPRKSFPLYFSRVFWLVEVAGNLKTPLGVSQTFPNLPGIIHERIKNRSFSRKNPDFFSEKE